MTDGRVETVEAKVERQLTATQRLAGGFRSVISTLPDTRAEAAAADARLAAGTARDLEGVTVAVKDVIDTAGHPTTQGSASWKSNIPEHDAEAVARLRLHGCIILSKANLSEFAMGATSQNPHFGDVANAWDPLRVAGGSSGGSAVAVALGLADVALGTDTGGSVIIPASFNGLTGLRPSLGAISNRGVLPVSHNFDTVGPIARDVATVKRMYSALAGFDPDDPDQLPPSAAKRTPADASLSGLQIGVVREDHFTPEEAAIAERLEAALEVLTELGASCVDVRLPGAEEAHTHMARQMFTDFYGVHATRFEEHPEEYGEDLRYRLLLGKGASGVEYSESRRWTQGWRHRLHLLFANVDAVVSATTAISAPMITSSSMAQTTPKITRFTHPWCLSLGPTLTVPIGFGLHTPVGMSITGPAASEPLVLSVGEAFQGSTNWHHRRPPASSEAPNLQAQPIVEQCAVPGTASRTMPRTQ